MKISIPKMAFIMITLLVQLYSTEVLFYLVAKEKNDKSLLYTEMESNESIFFHLISKMEDVI